MIFVIVAKNNDRRSTYIVQAESAILAHAAAEKHEYWPDEYSGVELYEVIEQGGGVIFASKDQYV